jgi:hypothetical protein
MKKVCACLLLVLSIFVYLRFGIDALDLRSGLPDKVFLKQHAKDVCPDSVGTKHRFTRRPLHSKDWTEIPFVSLLAAFLLIAYRFSCVHFVAPTVRRILSTALRAPPAISLI